MAKVAKIVWVSLGTRVIVEEGDTDEQVWEKAKSNLIESLSNDGMSHVEEILEDKECPFGTLNEDNES